VREPRDGPSAGLTLELVARIQGGDREAWNDLYRRLHDPLLFSVRCRLGAGLRRHLESEDILQSVILEALGELPRFAPRGEGSLQHFLHVLVSHKIRDKVDHYAARKRRGTVRLPDSAMDLLPAPEGAPAYRDAERYERLERCLLQLPGDQRTVILLRRIDGLSGAEAAREMKRSEAATRQLYSRALARLSALMAAGGGG